MERIEMSGKALERPEALRQVLDGVVGQKAAAEGLNVAKETLRGWMIEAGLWQAARGRRVTLHPPRPRRARVGEVVQIDGSPPRLVRRPRQALHAHRLHRRCHEPGDACAFCTGGHRRRSWRRAHRTAAWPGDPSLQGLRRRPGRARAPRHLYLAQLPDISILPCTGLTPNDRARIITNSAHDGRLAQR